jgi:hypothetical protein
VITEHATPEDFARWRSYAETCDLGALRFIIKDCRQVAENLKKFNPTREGYYADQAFTYADELARRLKTTSS